MAALPWEQIATSDKYRNDTPLNQFKVKQAWLQQVAPLFYGPDIAVNPQKRFALQTYMQNLEIGPKSPDEDAIVRREALSMTGASILEANPAFERKSYEEQQKLRQVWFAKMAAKDQEYRSLTPEQQMNFYKATMLRAPALQNKYGMPGSSAGQPQQLINTGYYDIDQTTKDFLAKEKGAQQAEAYARSSGASFVEAVGGWIAGPVRWLADKTLGEHNPLSSIFEDLEKYKTWQLAASEADNPIFDIAANIAGFIAPGNLLSKTTKALAGGWKTVQVGAKTLPMISTTGKFIRDAGVLERFGSKFKALQRIPSASYQIAGGTVAGALTGIGANMIEGEEPLSSLPQDLLLGAGLESVSRFWAARSLMKTHMKALGFKGSTKEFFNKPLDVTAGQSLELDFARTFFSHPIGKHLKQIAEQATKNGFPLQDYYVPQNVKLRASIINMDVVEEGGVLNVKRGTETVQTFTNEIPEVRWKQASEYLDQQDTAWERILEKPLEEQAQLLPGVKLIHGIPITNRSKEVLLDEINKKNLAVLGANFKLDPEMDDSKIGTIFKTIMKHDTKKAVSVLEQFGVKLRADIAPGDTATDLLHKKEAVVAAVKAELEQTLPEADFFFVRKSTNRILPREELPQIILENPNSLGVSILNGTYTLKMDNIRKTLLDVKKAGTSMKSRVTKIAKQHRVAVTRNLDSRVVELQIEVPNADGVFHPVTLHFNSELRALQFMRGEGKQEVRNLFKEDPEMIESFEQFRKNFRTQNRKEYEGSFVPYQYLAAEAQQKGFFLGSYKGKYILRDKFGGRGYTEFSDLYTLAKHLKEQDVREVLPDLTGIPQDAVEKLYPNGIEMPFTDKDPLRSIRTKPLKEKRFNILSRISMFTKPTQAMMDDFNRMPFAKQLREAGMDPMDMYNSLVRGTMADHRWMAERLDFLQRELKGFKEEEEIMLTRYMEGRLDHIDEDGITFESKAEVEAEMREKFGIERATQMVASATKLRKMLDQVFSEAGLDPAIYLDNYMPHLFTEARMMSKNTSGQLNLKEMTTWLPNTKRKEFMEYFREVDIVDAALERRAGRLTETYLRAASRKMFITPTLDTIKNAINRVSKEHWRTLKPTDAIAFIDYMRSIFRSIYGSKTASEIITTKAGAESITLLARRFKKDITVSKVNAIDKLTTLSTLGYLGARPYSVVKQLMSMVTIGGPYIQMQWMLEGINRLGTPGELQRLMKVGVVSQVLPTGAEFVTEGMGKVTKGISEAAMAPFKWGDDVSRAAVYLGMEARLLYNIRALRSGQITLDQFYVDSGMNLFGAGQFNYGKKLLDTNPTVNGDVAFVDHFAKLAADRTMFLYDRFQRPQLIRSSVGKLFGQFGVWPLNFLAMIKDRVSTDTLTIPQKIKTIAELGAATWAIAEGFKAVGINDPSWYPWNQVTFQGGPYYSLMHNLMKAASGDQQAYSNFTREFLNLIPFAKEGSSVFTAADQIGKGELWKGFLLLASAPIELETSERKSFPGVAEISALLKEGGKNLFQLKESLEK